MWTPILPKPYHHNAAVTRLVNNLPSPEKQSRRWALTDTVAVENTPAATCVTKVLLLLICSSRRVD